MPDELPNFIPKVSPDFFLLDLSHLLSAASVDSLKPIVVSGYYTPKVVVLPANYVSHDTAKLTQALVRQWNINGPGKTLLVVVDLKGHKVHAHGSPELARAGVSSDYITNSLIPHQFVPSMKKGDLATALKQTLADVNGRVSASTYKPNQIASTQAPPKVPITPMSDFAVNSIMLTLALVLILAIAFIFKAIKGMFFGGSRTNGSPSTSVFGNLRNSGYWNGGGHQPLGSWSNNPANDYTSSSDSYNSDSSSSSSDSSSSSSDSSSGSDGSGSW